MCCRPRKKVGIMEASPERIVSFRAMSDADLDSVMRNEYRAYAFPWTRGIFQDCLKSGYDCRLLCVNERICGHGVMSAAAGEAHLLNICVQRDLQGHGLGRKFARHMIDRARTLGASALFLEVRPSNRVAIALYTSLGFAEIGQRRDYYPTTEGREDALVYTLPLAE